MLSKFLKFLWNLSIAVVGSFAVFYIVMIFIFVSGSTSCNEDSESVAYARGLTKQRLTQLYHDMEKLSKSEQAPFWEIMADEGKFPEPFSDIQANRVRPKDENIMLNGCFDHYVYLHFHGFESNKQYYPNREIILSWGEHDNSGDEVLLAE